MQFAIVLEQTIVSCSYAAPVAYCMAAFVAASVAFKAPSTYPVTISKTLFGAPLSNSLRQLVPSSSYRSTFLSRCSISSSQAGHLGPGSSLPFILR